MLISTRGRYALRVLIDLAEHRNGAFIPMKDVAARQEISLKYLERILPALTAAELVEGQHGKGGGYRLLRDPESITVGEVLRLTEGDLAPVSCLEPGAKPCPRAPQCRTLPMWKAYFDQTNRFFNGITVKDLQGQDEGDDYVI